MIGFKSRDLDMYVSACINLASIYFWNGCSSIITPLRGAKMPVNVMKYVLDKRDSKYREYEIPTSGFLVNREWVIYEGLRDAFTSEVDKNENLSFMYPDAFISGSAFRNFKYLLKYKFIGDLINDLELSNKNIDFVCVALKQYYNNKNIELASDSVKHFKNNVNVRFKIYSIGLNRIISEDVPELLGVDYHNFKFIDYPGKVIGLRLPLLDSINSLSDVLVDNSVVKTAPGGIADYFFDSCKKKVDDLLSSNC